MIALRDQRCLNHALREAAARCPECAQFFCRECVVEHEDRILCAGCLRKITIPAGARSRWGGLIGKSLACLAATGAAWLFFFFIGQILLSIPSSFHEGTLWEAPQDKEP